VHGSPLAPDGTTATIKPGDTATVVIVTSESCGGGIDPTRYTDVALVVTGRSIAVPGLALETTCPVRVSTWYVAPD
jgi:hypothetical protein